MCSSLDQARLSWSVFCFACLNTLSQGSLRRSNWVCNVRSMNSSLGVLLVVAWSVVRYDSRKFDSLRCNGNTSLLQLSLLSYKSIHSSIWWRVIWRTLDVFNLHKGCKLVSNKLRPVISHNLLWQSICSKYPPQLNDCFLGYGTGHFNDLWPFWVGVYDDGVHSPHERTHKIQMQSLPWFIWPHPWVKWCWCWGTLYCLERDTVLHTLLQLFVESWPP